MLMPAPQTLAKKLNKDVFSLLEEGRRERERKRAGREAAGAALAVICGPETWRGRVAASEEEEVEGKK